jgi:hypothetical protein
VLGNNLCLNWVDNIIKKYFWICAKLRGGLKKVYCHAWWYTFVITALGKGKQEDHEFEDSLC